MLELDTLLNCYVKDDLMIQKKHGNKLVGEVLGFFLKINKHI